MKKILLVLIPVLMTASILAYDFEWDGMFRTRAAMYNNNMGTPGAHVDNRLQLGLKSELVPGLTLRAKFEIGQNGGYPNTIWGDGGGAISTNGIDVKTNEAYIDYRVEAIKGNVRIGQQYWADHRSLVLDDTFSGITFQTGTDNGIKAMLGYGKYNEGNFWNRYDDMQGLIFSVDTEAPITSGFQGYFTWSRINPVGTDPKLLKFVSLQPYATLKMDPLTLDAVLFVQSNDSYNPVNQKVEADLTFGAALNAGFESGPLAANGDVLFVSENGLGTLSNYYMNGLYIFGIGEHNDSLGRWFMGTTEDNYVGVTAKARYEVKKGLSAFGAAGMILGAGLEVNGGFEMQLVPDLLKLAFFGAYGIADEDFNDKNAYAAGSTIKLEF